jgi:hypothetical protein
MEQAGLEPATLAHKWQRTAFCASVPVVIYAPLAHTCHTHPFRILAFRQSLAPTFCVSESPAEAGSLREESRMSVGHRQRARTIKNRPFWGADTSRPQTSC